MASSEPKESVVSQSKRKQAFTVIELLVVIAAITILVGILFVSIGYVHRSMKERATKAQLGNLKGMLTELDSANGLKNSPVAFLWWNQGAIVNAPAAAGQQNYSVDFWRTPFHDPNVNTGSFGIDALRAPGNMATESQDGPGPRNGSPAIVNTSIAMSMMVGLPANRTRLQSIAQAQTFVPTWTDAKMLKPDAAATPVDVTYAPLAQVQLAGRFYAASSAYTVGTNTAPTPNSTTGPWTDITSGGRVAPLVLDGWGNPIIFVPASGLRVHLRNGNKEYKDSNGNYLNNTDFIVVSPEGRVVKRNTNNPQDGADPAVIQTGRPFFASAGADGNFETGDDNVYSFEQ